MGGGQRERFQGWHVYVLWACIPTLRGVMQPLKVQLKRYFKGSISNTYSQTCYETEGNPELLIILPLSPKCWDDRCVPGVCNTRDQIQDSIHARREVYQLSQYIPNQAVFIISVSIVAFLDSARNFSFGVPPIVASECQWEWLPSESLPGQKSKVAQPDKWHQLLTRSSARLWCRVPTSPLSCHSDCLHSES